MSPPPVTGMMAGMMDEEEDPAVERGDVPEPTDTRQHDFQRAEPAEEGDNEEPNVTPEEQAEYERFVEAGLMAMAEGGEIKPGIRQLLDEDPKDLIAALGDNIPELGERFSPIVAVAATAVIVTREAIERVGKPSGDVLLQGGRAILEALVELRDTMGDDFTQDEINQAWLHAIDIYRAVASEAGEVDDEEASAEFAEILNAQEQGRLGEVLPELERIPGNGRG